MGNSLKVRLAIDGGRPVRTKPFPPWPQFDRRTDRKVLEILHSGKVNYWTGPIGHQFESAFADWLGVKHAVSVSSGTAALHSALLALGIGPGDEVICPSSSFIASSTCVMQVGAQPVFVDVGWDFLLDPRKLAAAVSPRTKAIIVVHLFGMVADMDPLLKFARSRGLYVIEDCAQCIGGVYRGRKAGTLGTIGCFSFCQSKHFTTGGEGGMVCCNDDDLAWELRSVRDHGYDRRHHRAVHYRLGYNYRLTEMQSAIGIGELARLDDWNLPRRRKLGEALIEGLRGHPLVKRLPVDSPARRNCFWLVPVVLDRRRLTVPIGRFVDAVQAEGASAYAIGWMEMYRQEIYLNRRGVGMRNYPFDDPANRRLDYSQVLCARARELSESTIAFWTHPTYSLADIRSDLQAFNKVASEFTAVKRRGYLFAHKQMNMTVRLTERTTRSRS